MEGASEEQECRICLCEGENLLSPCACSGSTQYVHAKCLNRWRKQFDVEQEMYKKCDICKQDYNIGLLEHTHTHDLKVPCLGKINMLMVVLNCILCTILFVLCINAKCTEICHKYQIICAGINCVIFLIINFCIIQEETCITIIIQTIFIAIFGVISVGECSGVLATISNISISMWLFYNIDKQSQ